MAQCDLPIPTLVALALLPDHLDVSCEAKPQRDGAPRLTKGDPDRATTSGFAI